MKELVLCFPFGNILDLFLISNSERIDSCLVMPPLPRCSQSPVTCTYVFQDIHFYDDDSAEVTQRLWTKGRFDIMSDILNDHILTPFFYTEIFLNDI